jgi:hypothetical protein
VNPQVLYIPSFYFHYIVSLQVSLETFALGLLFHGKTHRLHLVTEIGTMQCSIGTRGASVVVFATHFFVKMYLRYSIVYVSFTGNRPGIAPSVWGRRYRRGLRGCSYLRNNVSL